MDKPSTAVADDIWPKLISCGLPHAQDSYSAMKPNSQDIIPEENIWTILCDTVKILQHKTKKGAWGSLTDIFYMRL